MIPPFLETETEKWMEQLLTHSRDLFSSAVAISDLSSLILPFQATGIIALDSSWWGEPNGDLSLWNQRLKKENWRKEILVVCQVIRRFTATPAVVCFEPGKKHDQLFELYTFMGLNFTFGSILGDLIFGDCTAIVQPEFHLCVFLHRPST